MSGSPASSPPSGARGSGAGGSQAASGPGSRPPWAQDGRRLGRYRMGPSLGRGGMGEVFEAWDTLLNRAVAVKTLHAPSPRAIVRFMREAQLQARVTHPNVCRIYDVEVAEGVPVIAMQLVRGPSLNELAGDLRLDEAVELLTLVAQAMHAAHRVQLIHRDLKPSNILLERAPGGGWIPYVADFGLAKDLEEEAVTQTQGVLGTPCYMAPEQRRGEAGLIGPATDVYALGATLCAVLNLDRWGSRPSPRASTAPALTGVPLPRWSGVPRPLRAILSRCLEERPQDRYPTAGALAEDLRRFLDGEPLLVEPGGWLRRLRGLARAHPAWTATLGLTAALGILAPMAYLRVSASGRRRAALALRFALDARDLENGIGIERLHPPHDLRPYVARMSLGLERIQDDIAQIGPEAEGPGHLALGRGYLTMRYLERARAALDRAWASGYRTPDVAYALCKVHTDIYLRYRELERLGDPPPPTGEAERHLKLALEFYPKAAGATWEPPELVGARLLTSQGRAAEAVVLARRLLEGNRWFYEAKVEEAHALAELGSQAQRGGDPRTARARYLEAEAAARAAQSIGRSDITCYLAAQDWRLRRLEAPGLAPGEALRLHREVEALADLVLTIRPESPRGLSAKVAAILGQARVRRGLGQDPRADLDRAEAFLRRVEVVDSYLWLVPAKREQVRQARLELGASGVS